MNEMTVAAALQAAGRQISPLDAEVLLAHVLGVSRIQLFSHPEKKLNSGEIQQFTQSVTWCAEGQPVAYLTGFREFWSLRLEVTPDVLIPRPETECLVEQVLSKISVKNAVIADCGTGSGAIALALGSERPGWQIHATDCSQKALKRASANAEKLGISNIIFHEGSWCAALPACQFDAIVSNPPYLAEEDPHLEALRYEPALALVSGSDGLRAITEMVGSAGSFLVPGGWLLLEHGFEQGDAVRTLFEAAGYQQVTTVKDLSGLERVTSGISGV